MSTSAAPPARTDTTTLEEDVLNKMVQKCKSGWRKEQQGEARNNREPRSCLVIAGRPNFCVCPIIVGYVECLLHMIVEGLNGAAHVQKQHSPASTKAEESSI